jgi:hypothetical protein
MRRALASIRFSPADRPRVASRPARSRTTSTTWTRSPDASFSRFALYRRDQSRASSPPLSTFYTTADLNASWEPFPRTRSPVPRMTAIGDTVMPRRAMPETITRTRNLSGAARTIIVKAGVQDAHDCSMGHGRHPGDGQVAVRRAVSVSDAPPRMLRAAQPGSRPGRHHASPLLCTDLPQAAGSNIPANIALGNGCTDFVECLARPTVPGHGR